MKLMRILYIIVAWGIEIFAFQRWFSCWLFVENFYFTTQDLVTHLTNDTNADQDMPIIIVRLIHNKVFALLWGLLQAVLQYWDIRFLEEFIGVIGAIGVALGIWYFLTRDRKNIGMWILSILGIMLPVVYAFIKPNVHYVWILLVFGFIFQAISLYGIWQFLEKSTKNKYLFLTILFCISILFLVLFPIAYQNFCIKI